MQRGRHVYKKEKLSLVATPLYISKIKQTEDFNFAALANNWKKKKRKRKRKTAFTRTEITQTVKSQTG